MLARDRIPSILACLLLTFLPAAEPLLGGPTLPVHSRRPVALALIGPHLFVANGHGGSVSVVDTRRLRVVTERHLGKRLSDLLAFLKGL